MTAIPVFKYFRVCIHLERIVFEGVFKETKSATVDIFRFFFLFSF